MMHPNPALDVIDTSPQTIGGFTVTGWLYMHPNGDWEYYSTEAEAEERAQRTGARGSVCPIVATRQKLFQKKARRGEGEYEKDMQEQVVQLRQELARYKEREAVQGWAPL